MKISIEGSIGSGKTTVINKIHNTIGIPIFLEPVDKWSKWLELYYKDPSRWGTVFNIKVLLSYNEWKNNKKTVIYERSPLACNRVFTKLQHKNKLITDMEYELFQDVYKQIAWEPDYIIYIRTKPETAYERMKKRNRECESEVPLEYLIDLHTVYEELVLDMKESHPEKIFIVDGENSSDVVYENIKNILKQIL